MSDANKTKLEKVDKETYEELEEILDTELKEMKNRKRKEKQQSIVTPIASDPGAGSIVASEPGTGAQSDAPSTHQDNNSTADDVDMTREPQILCIICRNTIADELRMNQVLPPKFMLEQNQLCGPECAMQHMANVWVVPKEEAKRMVPWWNHPHIRGRLNKKNQFLNHYHPIGEEEHIQYTNALSVLEYASERHDTEAQYTQCKCGVVRLWTIEKCSCEKAKGKALQRYTPLPDNCRWMPGVTKQMGDKDEEEVRLRGNRTVNIKGLSKRHIDYEKNGKWVLARSKYDEDIRTNLEDLPGILIQTLRIEKEICVAHIKQDYLKDLFRTGFAIVMFESAAMALAAITQLKNRRLGGNTSLGSIWTRNATRFDFTQMQEPDEEPIISQTRHEELYSKQIFKALRANTLLLTLQNIPLEDEETVMFVLQKLAVHNRRIPQNPNWAIQRTLDAFEEWNAIRNDPPGKFPPSCEICKIARRVAITGRMWYQACANCRQKPEARDDINHGKNPTMEELWRGNPPDWLKQGRRVVAQENTSEWDLATIEEVSEDCVGVRKDFQAWGHDQIYIQMKMIEIYQDKMRPEERGRVALPSNSDESFVSSNEEEAPTPNMKRNRE